MKKNVNKLEANNTKSAVIPIKMGLASFMAVMKLKESTLSQNFRDKTDEAVAYPKDTFLTAYDPLESL